LSLSAKETVDLPGVFPGGEGEDGKEKPGVYTKGKSRCSWEGFPLAGGGKEFSSAAGKRHSNSREKDLRKIKGKKKKMLSATTAID